MYDIFYDNKFKKQIMKKTIILVILILSIFVSGCSDTFLDTKDLTSKNDQNFPASLKDLNQLLMSVYASQRNGVNGGTPWPKPGMMYYSFILSDEWIAAGGANDKMARSAKVWLQSDVEQTSCIWKSFYQAIYRANFILEKYKQVTNLTETDANKLLGQTYYLRGSCFFDLCRTFGQVPLTISTSPQNLPKASVDELYGTIASDLKNAIEMLPSVPFASKPKSEYGLATKWAAEALMAKVFLFYTGYYNKTELPISGGGTITKATALAWLEDCIDNSGHGLVSDFRNLWPYSYLPKETYRFNGAINGFTSETKWKGESGDNEEVVYSINLSATGLDNTSGNVTLQFVGQAYDLIPWGRGWGHMNINTSFFANWPNVDLRKKATISDLKDINEGVLDQNGKLYTQLAYQSNYRNQTGLFVKKASRINLLGSNGKFLGMCSIYGRTPNNGAMDLFQNIVTMRFADVLLMAAEMGSPNALAYLNMVRSRAGLSIATAVNLDLIKTERMYEFAYEGIRFYDLLRWHDYESAVNAMGDIPVISQTIATKISYKGTFRSETGGFLFIPYSQIQLSNGVLEQNAGWDQSVSSYTGD